MRTSQLALTGMHKPYLANDDPNYDLCSSSLDQTSLQRSRAFIRRGERQIVVKPRKNLAQEVIL